MKRPMIFGEGGANPSVATIGLIDIHAPSLRKMSLGTISICKNHN